MKPQDNIETISLDYPKKVGGIEYDNLTLRRPIVKDIIIAEKAKGSDAEQEVRMFANLCEVAPDVIEGLDLSDYGKLKDAYRSFLG